MSVILVYYQEYIFFGYWNKGWNSLSLLVMILIVFPIEYLVFYISMWVKYLRGERKALSVKDKVGAVLATIMLFVGLFYLFASTLI